MTVQELYEKLGDLPSDALVMVRDVVAYRVASSPYTVVIEKADANDHADCECIVGETVVVI